MIKVEHKSGHIVIAGHAEYAPAGQDIVCAAVSTLAQNLIGSIEQLTEDEIEYEISSGRIDIKHENPSEEMKLLIDSFFLGIGMIAEEYPDHVRMK